MAKKEDSLLELGLKILVLVLALIAYGVYSVFGSWGLGIYIAGVTTSFIAIFVLYKDKIIGLMGGKKSQSELFSCQFEQKPLLSNREKKLYEILKTIYSKYEVFAQVRVIDIIKSVSSDKKQAYGQDNKINRLHFDFVIYDLLQDKTLCVIECDDSSHLSANAIKRDTKKNEACRLAGLQLIRIPSGNFSLNSVGDIIEATN